MLVVVPDRPLAHTDAAALWITGGDNGGKPNQAPDASDEDVLVCASLAVTVGTVCSVLYQIPNADIVFAADPLQKARGEDALVAFTWAQYMLHDRARPEWIAYFPMAKAGIKAMDATTCVNGAAAAAVARAPGAAPRPPSALSAPPSRRSFVTNLTGSTLTRWVTAGASKRGATTWFTGAVDKRIIGIVPIVFDVLSFKDGVQHMWRTLGNWTFAFTDYRDMNITLYLNDGTDNMDVLAAQVDPLAYAENLTMSKLVVDATGDEFFQPQDDDFWWGKLPGESLRMMVDNAEHSMATGALYLITGAEAWFAALLAGQPRPTFTWQRSPAGDEIAVTVTGQQPVAVVNRMATTLDGYRRDFRLVAGNTPANPCKYIPVPVFGSACLRPMIWIGNTIGATTFDPATQTSTYIATQDAPDVGWRAFLVELYFNSTIPGLYMQLTTQVAMLPAPGTPLYPFELCTGVGCIGDLV